MNARRHFLDVFLVMVNNYYIDNANGAIDMNMEILVKQSLEAASKITGKDAQDAHTQNVAFMLACAAMAEAKHQ